MTAPEKRPGPPMNYDRENVGTNVWTRRVRLGMSQTELGERIGVGVAWISRLESGDTYPSLVRVLELATLFECTPNDLLAGEPT